MQYPPPPQPQTDTPATVLKRVDQPIASATGLPNTCYVDDAAFHADREKVFAPNWACIGFADQLPEQNFAVPLDFMGLPLLLTRDQADEIRVFHNVCSHRGMQLADKPCKNNGTLRCPYHNWTYALNGELRGTPHIGGFGEHTHPDFDKTVNGLREVRSASWLGAIFINLSGDARTFEEFIQPVKQQWSKYADVEKLDRFNLSDDGSRMSLTVQSNWKLTVENYLESYHLPSVHPELNRISPLDQHYCVEPFENGGGQGSKNYQRLEIGGVQLPALAEWPEQHARNSEYPVLYPNTFFGIHADQLFILYLQPHSPHETTEHVRIFYVNEGAVKPEYQAHREKMLKGWDSVFREDIFAVERMQKGRHSPAYAGGAFSPVMDGPTHHFHKWVAHKLAKTEMNN